MSRDSLTRPILELSDVLRRFVRVTELRLLFLECDGTLRDPAATTVLGFEYHADNRSPFVVVQLDGSDRDKAWDDASQQLRARAEELAAAGGPMGELPPAPAGKTGSARFSAQLLQWSGALAAPAEGLVCIFRLRRVPESDFIARLEDFVGASGLRPVRFVVLSPRHRDLARRLEALPAKETVFHRVVVDPQTSVKELRADVEATESGLATAGAWPRGVRPPGAAPAPDQAPVVAVYGPSPQTAHAGESDRAEPAPTSATPAPAPPETLALLMKKACLHKAEGDGPAAIRYQARARDLCIESGDVRAAVRMEMILATFMLELEQVGLAADTFEKAARRAHDAGHHDLAAEAFLAQATLHTNDGQDARALRSYRFAIASGERANRPPLVLEAYWRAGLRALAHDLEVDCIGLWADAIAYARELEPEQTRGTRSKIIAKRLRELLAKHRRYAEARTIEREAEKFR